MLSVVSAGAAAGMGGMDRLRGGRAARDLAATRDRQVRLHAVHTDIAINLPPSIAMPDGEEHPFTSSRLHLRDAEQVRMQITKKPLTVYLIVDLFVHCLLYFGRSLKYIKNASDHLQIAQYWSPNPRPHIDRIRPVFWLLQHSTHHHRRHPVPQVAPANGRRAAPHWSSVAIRCRPLVVSQSR